MNVLVAGATGFIGRHVVAALRSRGHAVVALGRGSRATPNGARTSTCDLARDAPAAEWLAGCEAVVNLVGIKRESGTQTFEAVHVEATRRLVDAARSAGVRRLVHVSVVCSRPDPTSAYHDTKWRAEQVVRESGLAFTILRPGVVYGPGDDMVAHLAKMIRCVPVFPIVGRGRSLLQPVDVGDVAGAVAAALECAESVGRSYELVGPHPLTLRQVVATVADGLGLPTLVVPTPMAVMRPAVWLMDKLTPAPLSTPSQLRMLAEGLTGDPEPARRDLGVQPRPFVAEAARAAADGVPPLLGTSLRVDGPEVRAWLRPHAGLAGRAAGLAALAVLLQVVLAASGLGVWARMAANAALLLPVALLGVPVGWRALYRPSWRHVAQGVASAVALYAAGALVARALEASPVASGQIAAVYRWKTAIAPEWTMPVLLFIIAGEEIVWRNAVTIPLAARLGPWAGTVAAAMAFGLAHVPMGIPVLVAAAVGAGTFWSLLVLRTRSAVPALVSHVTWDVAVLLVFPYGGA